MRNGKSLRNTAFRSELPWERQIVIHFPQLRGGGLAISPLQPHGGMGSHPSQWESTAL